MSQKLLSLVLVAVLTNCVSCTTFHIIRTLNSSCPGEFNGEPCLTLAQYVANPSQSRPNITFQFEPGTHYLPDVLTVSNGQSLTISSTNVTIICTSSTAKITITSVENVHISGMTFQWCNNTAVTLSGVTNAQLDNNYFTQNFKWFGKSCLSITSSSVVITDSVFYYNRGTITASYSNITIHRSTFSHTGFEIIIGGALNVVLDRCIGTNNVARPWQALIYVRSQSNVTIDRSIFHNNTARVLATSRTLINRSTFSYNVASEGGGGAIAASPLTVMNSVFHANKAYYTHGRYVKGGAIQASAELVVHNCTFTSNVAIGPDPARGVNIRGEGGAIYFSGHRYTPNVPALIRLSNSTFINNSVIDGDGGAIYLASRKIQLIVSSCYFENSTSSDYGGAIYSNSDDTSLNISDSTFTNSTALAESGGTIYCNSQNANITLTSSTFNHSSAARCGVIDIDNFNHIVVIKDSVFASNKVSGQFTGGGVACIRNATLNITGSDFLHNAANFQGGVFYIDESKVRVEESSFINNSAAVDGGVFYTYVHASSYDFRRSQFSHNSAGDDGGVAFLGRELGKVYVEETIFDHNSAADRGGVISMINSSIEIESIVAFNNTAPNGEVISACNSNVTFTSNELFRRVDPAYSFCTLFDGALHSFNITTLQTPIVTVNDPPQTDSTSPTPMLTEMTSHLPSSDKDMSTTSSSMVGATTTEPISKTKSSTTIISTTLDDTNTIIIQPTDNGESTITPSPLTQDNNPTGESTTITPSDVTTKSQRTVGDGNDSPNNAEGIGVIAISLIALLATVSLFAVLSLVLLTMFFSYKMKKVQRQWIIVDPGEVHTNTAYRRGAGDERGDNNPPYYGIDADSIHSYEDADANLDNHDDMDSNAGDDANSIHSYEDADANLDNHDDMDSNAGDDANSVHTYIEIII